MNANVMLINEMPHGSPKISGSGKDMVTLSLDDDTVARHLMVKR